MSSFDFDKDDIDKGVSKVEKYLKQGCRYVTAEDLINFMIKNIEESLEAAKGIKIPYTGATPEWWNNTQSRVFEKVLLKEGEE